MKKYDYEKSEKDYIAETEESERLTDSTFHSEKAMASQFPNVQ